MHMNIATVPDAGSRAHTYKGTMELRTFVPMEDGSLHVSLGGLRSPTSDARPTEYDGALTFKQSEIIQLFRQMVRGTHVSAEFKRVCNAVADELANAVKANST